MRMSKIRLTYQPTSDPKDAQPGRLEFDTIPQALAAAYELRASRGFHAATDIRQGDTSLYDVNTIAIAVFRIIAFKHLDNMSLDAAAERAAKEDGY